MKPMPCFRLVLLSVALAVVVVILGAFTRLVDAGLGCPDWPGCYGHLWAPISEQAITTANQLYPDNPVDLSKTWPEMVHRYFASALGFMAILILVFSIRSQAPMQPVKLPLALLILIIVQGLFGMWTVTLKLWPQVVTAHLLGGFATLSLLWLLALRLSGWQSQMLLRANPFAFDSTWRLANIALGVVVTQVALGGWTSANYAAFACPDFPMCQGQWMPNANWEQGFNFFQTIGPNYLGGQMNAESRVAIHFSHRLGAIVVSLLCLALALNLFRKGAIALSSALVGALILQIFLGISNVLLALPLTIAVAHNAGGALLLLVLVTINQQLHLARYQSRHASLKSAGDLVHV